MMLQYFMPRAQDLDAVAPDDTVPLTPIRPDNSPPKNTFRDEVYKILGQTKHSLSSFLVHPKIFSFTERDNDEEIILVLRRHWFTNIHWLLIALLMVFFPVFIPLVHLLDYFPGNFQFIAVLFWYLITFAFAFEQFLSWYFNVCIITDERVIDIDFNNLLVKKFTDAKISMIQDVTSTVVGVSQTVFNYGDILVQTASEIPEICFNKIPSPEKVVKVLQQLRQEEEQEALEGRVR